MSDIPFFDPYATLVVGQKVWRVLDYIADDIRVEEGVVTSIETGRLDARGRFTPIERKSDGEKLDVLYHARFGGWCPNPAIAPRTFIGGDRLSQAYQWLFYADEAQAVAELGRRLRGWAEARRRQADDLDRRASEADTRLMTMIRDRVEESAPV